MYLIASIFTKIGVESSFVNLMSEICHLALFGHTYLYLLTYLFLP